MNIQGFGCRRDGWLRRTRALVLTAAAGAAAVCAAADRPAVSPSEVSVTTLGTAGGPGAMVERAGIATLVTMGGKRFLVDAGDGVTRQLARAGLSESDIGTVFLTHLHDDHTAGLPALMTFAYTRLAQRMEIIGPPRTRQLVEAAVATLAVSAEIRMQQNRRLKAPATVFAARDVEPGPVFTEGSVRVTALENTHYDFPAGSAAAAHRSYALKFEGGGRTVVLTGDTGVSEALTAFARGADVLVSEIASAADVADVPPFVREHMLKEHLSPRQVGELAAQAGVGTLVVSHMRKVSPADKAEIQRVFAGRVLIAEDMDRVVVTPP